MFITNSDYPTIGSAVVSLIAVLFVRKIGCFQTRCLYRAELLNG